MTMPEGSQEIFDAAARGEITVDEAMDRVLALSFANAAAPSAQQVADQERDVRDELDAAASFNPYRVEGDPDPSVYARLTAAQMAEVERVKPGVGERMQALQRWDADNQANAQREEAARIAQEHAHRMATDPAYYAEQQREQALRKLDASWNFSSIEQRRRLAAQAGLNDKQYAALDARKAKLNAERFGPAPGGDAQ